eukprot:768571-Hanusia_phi.AAC.10
MIIVCRLVLGAKLLKQNWESMLSSEYHDSLLSRRYEKIRSDDPFLFRSRSLHKPRQISCCGGKDFEDHAQLQVLVLRPPPLRLNRCTLSNTLGEIH